MHRAAQTQFTAKAALHFNSLSFLMEINIRHFLFLGIVIFMAYGVSGSNAFAFPRPKARVLIDPNSEPLTTNYEILTLNRSSFPEGFVFGSGTSSYQVEGAWNDGGKGPSVWDTFTHTFPEKIKDHSNGDVATDSYYQYKEDVRLMKATNLDAYRFSISWPRVLPRGKISKGVNEEGIQYYNNLINELLSKGITPYVTLYHWELPQALQDEYGGFLSPEIIDDFRDYAELCFKRFGDRVKHWTTLNEPWTFSSGGYDSGHSAPGRCSSWMNPSCPEGESATEPYLATHYQLLAHSAAVKLYREKYQALQKGKIGITLVAAWMVPYSDSKLDSNAAKRALDFMLGWCLKPLTKGYYPKTMRSIVGKRLPRFTREQSKNLKGSFDFLGMNYYTAYYAAHVSASNAVNVSYETDSLARLSYDRNGTLIGEQAGSEWLHIYPRGLYDLLLYIKREHNNPPIYITENGIDEVDNSTLSLRQALADNFRIKYYYQHLSYMHQAMKHGVNVMGYFAWSILDNFEHRAGYTSRFGLHYVDFRNGLKRYPKLSAKWFRNFLEKKMIISSITSAAFSE